MNPYYSDSFITLYNTSSRRIPLPDESVHCVVTSPPYWNLRKYEGDRGDVWGGVPCLHEWDSLWQRPAHPDRSSGGRDMKASGVFVAGRDQPAKAARGEAFDYGETCVRCGAWRGKYGLEPTVAMYIAHSLKFLLEIRRVLRPDGIVFWNIGDSYFGSPRATGCKKTRNLMVAESRKSNHFTIKQEGLKSKDMCLIPQCMAIAAQDAGWYVRSIIVWSKPNPMPGSQKDRPTTSHEYILMLTKSERYFYDAEAVKEPLSESTMNDKRNSTGRHTQCEEGKFSEVERPDLPSWYRGKAFVNADSGRNLRTVWTFPTQPCSEKHYAVFPDELADRCIKAGTSDRGCCPKCGAPWRRILNRKFVPAEDVTAARGVRGAEGTKGACAGNRNDGYPRGRTDVITEGWTSSCKCGCDNPVPCTVLDPFSGRGTTLRVARGLGRNAVGCEISAEYCAMAARHLRKRQQIKMTGV